ncbi:unnamed protein product [Arctogadus glacialis]
MPRLTQFCPTPRPPLNLLSLAVPPSSAALPLVPVVLSLSTGPHLLSSLSGSTPPVQSQRLHTSCPVSAAPHLSSLGGSTGPHLLSSLSGSTPPVQSRRLHGGNCGRLPAGLCVLTIL